MALPSNPEPGRTTDVLNDAFDAALKGDSVALAALVSILRTRYGQEIKKLLRHHRGTAHTATMEDIFQQSIVDFMEQIKSGALAELPESERSDAVRYFKTLCDRKLEDLRKSRKDPLFKRHKQPLHDGLAKNRRIPEVESESNPHRDLLLSEIDALDPFDRLVIQRYIKDVPYSEIAKETGKKIGTLESLVTRIKEKLLDQILLQSPTARINREREKAPRHSELGASVRTLAADATEPAAAAAAIGRAWEEFGGFHGLYHVAGGSGRRHGDGPLHELSDAGWQHTLHLNLTSVFHSNRAAVREFLRHGAGGSIVNCGSVLGFSPSPKFFATHAYAAAKAAIVGLTRSAAATYAPQNIRLNVLAPGLVATPMSQRAQSDEAILRFIQTKQPLDGGRIGRPEDLDAAVVWLLSDESRFVTGQVIAVDGGWGVTDGSSNQ